MTSVTSVITATRPTRPTGPTRPTRPTGSTGWRARLVGLVTVLGAVLATTALTAAPAQADFGGSGSGGFTVAVHVNVHSGSGDPISSGGLTISVPPQCYWTTSRNFDSTSAQAFMDFYKSSLPYLQGSESAAGYYAFPTFDEIKRILDAEKAGQDYTWYELECQPGVNGAEEGYTNSNWTTPASYGQLGNQPVPVAFKAFQADVGPPPPLIDVKDLTQSLWDVASRDIENPDLDRNPTINAAAGGTLVNLDTWFWVTNTVAALAQDGKIHLEADVPGTPVRAVLDAATKGVNVTSPAGSRGCTVTQAKTAYTHGTSAADPCTVAFERSNRGGWPVTASIQWTGTWSGVDNNGPQNGTLEPQARSTTVEVPVVESQALNLLFR